MQDHRDNKDNSAGTFEQRYKTLLTVFDTLGPSFVIDHNGTILEANQDFAVILGRQVHECIGKNAYDLIPPELTAIGREKVDEALRTGKIITYEDERVGRFNRFMFVPIADKEGKLTRLSITVQDITLLRMAENELLKLNVVSAALINQIPGVVVIMDGGGRLVQWNAYERDVIVGKSESEMANTFLIETIHPDDRQLVGEKISTLFQSDHEDSAEVRVLIHGGPEFRWFKISAKRIIINDIPFLIGLGSDITERKKFENDLVLSNRTLQMLRKCNEIMLHSRNEVELLDAICRIIVEIGGYRMVWVGYAEQDNAKSVSPVAHAGFDEGYRSRMKVSWANVDRGRGPTGTAIRTGKPSLTRDVLNNPQFEP